MSSNIRRRPSTIGRRVGLENNNRLLNTQNVSNRQMYYWDTTRPAVSEITSNTSSISDTVNTTSVVKQVEDEVKEGFLRHDNNCIVRYELEVKFKDNPEDNYYIRILQYRTSSLSCIVVNRKEEGKKQLSPNNYTGDRVLCKLHYKLAPHNNCQFLGITGAEEAFDNLKIYGKHYRDFNAKYKNLVIFNFLKYLTLYTSKGNLEIDCDVNKNIVEHFTQALDSESVGYKENTLEYNSTYDSREDGEIEIAKDYLNNGSQRKLTVLQIHRFDKKMQYKSNF